MAARIALGLVFTLAGASIFVLIGAPAADAAGPRRHASRRPSLRRAGSCSSTWSELTAGVLLLANRFVPFALVLLAAILSNILVFHITMQPQTILLPLVLTGLWFVLAYQHRETLTQLLK